MRTYNHVSSDRQFTAQDMIDDARRELDYLKDEGDQMHRRAVVGKTISAHTEGFSYDWGSPDGGYIVGIRVERQYANISSGKVSTKEIAEELTDEINELLSKDPIGIAE